MADTVYNEKIVVSVTDQSGPALRNIQRTVDQAEAKLQSVSSHPWSIVVNAVDNATKMVGQISAGIGKLVASPVTIPVRLASMIPGAGALAGSIMGGVGTGIGMALANTLGSAAGAIGGSIVGMNATLETSTLQFETLMGNADEAKQHVADLFQFAKVTPFETQPVIDASRTLRTFGGAALDTMDNLTLFGDAAAATNSNIQEVSFWMGRAYAAMQGGQPFGEATMRLQELAILSPQAALKMQQMSAAGAKASDMWAVMTQSLQRFNGAMARQASTWEGLTSTLSDAIHLTSAKVFAPLFTVAKNAVGNLIDALSSDSFMAWADTAGQAISDFVTTAGVRINDFMDMIKAIGTAFTDDQGALGVVYDLVRKVFGEGAANFIQPFLQSLMDFMPTLREVGQLMGFAFQDLQRGDLANVLIDVKAAFAALTGIDLNAFFAPLGQALDQLQPTWQRITTVANGFGEALGKLIPQPIQDFVSNLVSTGQAASQSADPLNGFVQIVNGMSEALSTAWHWLEQHKEVQSVLAGIISAAIIGMTVYQAVTTAVAVAQGIATLATQGWAAAMTLLNLVMDANPFFLVVTAVAALAGALIYAYNTSEDFRNIVDPILHQIGDAVNWLWQNVLQPAIPGMLQLWDDLKNNTIQTLLLLPIRLAEIGAEMVNGLIKGMTGVDVLGWIRANITDKIPDFIKNALGIHSPSTVMAGIGTNMMQGLIGGLQNMLPSIMAFAGNLSNVFGGMGADVSGWIAAAIQATGVPGYWAGPLAGIIQNESGGNPSAANLWDVNAQRGDPSTGLMQLTQSNQARYTPAGLNPMDPIAQIIAGIRYIQSTYGDIGNVPGVKSLAAGGAYQPYDTGGILPPGLTMAANNTGQAEYVLRPSGGGQASGNLTFAPQVTIDARGASPGVADDLEARFNALMVRWAAQLGLVLGNMSEEGAPA